MTNKNADRRSFLRNATGGVIAAAAVSTSAQSAAAGHHEVITQTKATQAAMTPDQALQMLKDGNDRFVQGNMLQRDYKKQVKETGGNQFPFAAIVLEFHALSIEQNIERK